MSPYLWESTLNEHLLAEKEKRLFKALEKYSSLMVAFSGGVDSTYLLYAARQVMGGQVIAITAVSDIHPARETAAAKEFCRQMGIYQVFVNPEPMNLTEFIKNSQDRCYVCKKQLFAVFFNEAEKNGIQYVAHGANLDDDKDFRPGLKAAREMGVAAPMAEAKFNKQDIRDLSRKAGLSTWDKPASGCLATRIPYGTEIRYEELKRVEKGEQILVDAGFSECRVRFYGSLAKIEVSQADINRLVRPEHRTHIVNRFREIGFLYVAVDLEAYQSGRLNRSIQEGE